MAQSAKRPRSRSTRILKKQIRRHKLRLYDLNNCNLFIPLALTNYDYSIMTEAEQEKDSHFIRRLVIIIFIVFTLAAVVMTIFYGTPWAKK